MNEWNNINEQSHIKQVSETERDNQLITLITGFPGYQKLLKLEAFTT